MNNDLYQNIFDVLVDVLPSDWNKVAFMAGYTKGSYSMKYYVKTENGDYLDCFEIGNIDNIQILELFMKLDKIISQERSSLKEEKWNVISMVVDSTGKMKTDFDYSDISENMIEYENQWKQKYLV